MNNNLEKEKIIERYSKVKDTDNLGCANLSPFLNIKKNDYILDLGCGNGSQAIRLSEITGEKGLVYGLDLSETIILNAKSKNNKSNVKFVSGDIEKLPFENGYFNLIISNCVINHSMKKKSVFSEIYRVLKKGGYFLIGDVMSVDKIPYDIANNPENIAACWGGAILKSEYLSIITDIGFKNVQELSNRQYMKNDFLLESIIIKGEKE